MASTLVHMNCTQQLTNAMVVGMEPDSAEELLPGEERGKRDHDLDDSEQNQVKKRRKQSNPMRITSSEGEIKSSSLIKQRAQDVENMHAFVYEGSVENMNDIQCPNGDSNALKNDYNSDGVQVSNMIQDIKEIKSELSFPLNLSNAKSLSPQNSVDSITVTDEKLWYKEQNNMSPYQMSVSESFQLKNQFYQNNVLLPSQPSPLMLPSIKNMVIGNAEPQIGSPHRIFNPEAFCDLCNKEFCNKYFLKTHRANKHGIYNEVVCSNLMDNLTSLPIINYFSNNNSGITVNNHQLTKKNGTGTPNINSKTNNGSLRAFCNICQREFCNKYFVRRHKAKIHGIVESHTDESQEFKPQAIFGSKLDVNDVNLPGPSSLKGTKETFNGVSEETISKVKKENDIDSEGNTSPQSALNLLVSTWQSEESKDLSLSPDRLKKMGVVNNSAFCDICCKEYCNKYFLRTHKQKCHGILVSEKDEKNTSSSNGWKVNQSVPLNLILRDTSKDDAESDDIGDCQTNSENNANRFTKNNYEQGHGGRKSLNHLDAGQINKNLEDSPKYRTSHDKNGVTPDISEKEPISETSKINSGTIKVNQNSFSENFICEVCNKDLGQATLLEGHILKEHPLLLDEISNNHLLSNDESSNFQVAHSNANLYTCSKCQKSCSSFNMLEQHLNEHHQSDLKYQTKQGGENIDFSGQQIYSGERQNVTTPTSSFCDICKKELCNKYFMKTHMQRMHGISIENGAHIGGVVCDICNKELCSKYFLRVHKQNSHGIVEEAFLPQLNSDVKPQNQATNQTLKLSENQLSHRYFSHFTEVCLICSRRFRSTKWLKAHLLNDHGEDGKDKLRDIPIGNRQLDRVVTETYKKSEISAVYAGILKNTVPETELGDGGPSTSENLKLEHSTSSEKANEMLNNLLNKSASQQYQCSYCHFTSPVLALLFVHERSHTISLSEKFKCPVCMANFETNDNLEKHIIAHQAHNYPGEQNVDSTPKYKDNAQFLHGNHNIGDSDKSSTKDDNNYGDVQIPKHPNQSFGEPSLKCLNCPFTSHRLEHYIEHIQNEHKKEEKNIGSLQILREALLQLANSTLIPASFAVPKNYGNFTMQPFVLEDKAPGPNMSTTFLSSLVFLPVKERLNKPVTASFKLTPT